VLNIYFCT